MTLRLTTVLHCRLVFIADLCRRYSHRCQPVQANDVVHRRGEALRTVCVAWGDHSL